MLDFLCCNLLVPGCLENVFCNWIYLVLQTEQTKIILGHYYHTGNIILLFVGTVIKCGTQIGEFYLRMMCLFWNMVLFKHMTLNAKCNRVVFDLHCPVTIDKTYCTLRNKKQMKWGLTCHVHYRIKVNENQ